MKKVVIYIALAIIMFGCCKCTDSKPTSDKMLNDQQEQLMNEANKQVGMPAIKNFQERKLLKQVLELRDQENLVCYAYLWNEFNGKKVFFCDSIGFGIPYATQFTNPQKVYTPCSGYHVTMPQADPNGLFSPASAEGTWILCKNPDGKDVKPVYVEPRVIVSPFKLNP